MLSYYRITDDCYEAVYCGFERSFEAFELPVIPRCLKAITMSTTIIRTAEEHKATLVTIEQHGGIRQASRVLGIPYATLRERASAARAHASAVRQASAPVGDAGLNAVLMALVESQRQQGELLARLMPQASVAPAGKPAKKARKPVADEDVEEVAKPVSGGTVAPPESRRIRRNGRRYIVTAAQNNTDCLPGFVPALEVLAAHIDAEILVSAITYNKGAYDQPHRVTKDDDSLWYDPAIVPYLCNEPTVLADGLVFCGEMDILPTAVDPLSGLDSYTKSASAIIPHTKVAMKSMATMKSEPARFLFTTGACTQMNYVQRRAGLKAEHHHVFSALLVEVDVDGGWFVRQIVAGDDGSFQDLDTVYSATGMRPSHVEAITWGDFHEEKACPEVFSGCFGPGGLLETLRPRQQHVHDLADMRARNHHNLKDPYFLATMHHGGTERVEDDVARCAGKLEAIERPWCQTVVVESNHDQALKRWLCEADGHRDPANARYWHFLNYRIFDAIEQGQDLFVFEAAVRSKARTALANTTFLKEDTSWVICPESGGIECGLHGHRGPNGSRGSPKGYRQLGRRCNTGHVHSAGIVDGIYTAGVSGSMDMGYNVGPSSWSHSHILTYPSGKRAIVTMRGSKWRAS